MKVSKKIAVSVLGLSLLGGFPMEPRSTGALYNPNQDVFVPEKPSSRLERMLASVKFGPKHASAKEIGHYNAPSLDGYTFDKEWKTDIDKDGVKETTVTQYKNSLGGKIIRLSAENGTVWAWAVRSNNYPRDKDDLTKNYTIRDSNCDNIFDEKLDNNEIFGIPSCLK